MGVAIPGAGLRQAWATTGTRITPTQRMSSLYDKIDTAKTGNVTKAQFLEAFQAMNPPSNFKAAGAEAVWARLDPTGTGSVSKQGFVDGMVTMMTSLRAQQVYVPPVNRQAQAALSGPNSLLGRIRAMGSALFGALPANASATSGAGRTDAATTQAARSIDIHV